MVILSFTVEPALLLAHCHLSRHCFESFIAHQASRKVSETPFLFETRLESQSKQNETF